MAEAVFDLGTAFLECLLVEFHMLAKGFVARVKILVEGFIFDRAVAGRSAQNETAAA